MALICSTSRNPASRFSNASTDAIRTACYLLLITLLSVKAIPALAQARFDEPYATGWQLYFDNDLFAGANTDRDYTGGFALAYSGRRAKLWPWSLDAWLERIDQATALAALRRTEDAILRHTMEFGLLLFTPEDISSEAPLPLDHPFGNFLFVTSSQQLAFPEKRRVLQSALTIGLLGTRAGPEFQQLIHSATGSDPPRGWHNQISDGGELSGKYSIMLLSNLAQSDAGQSDPAQGEQQQEIQNGQRQGAALACEISSTVEGNIGLNTDITFSLSTRFGQLRSPWWSFVPHQSDYINLGQTIAGGIDDRSAPAEFFFWAGAKVRLSLYNGFLQGQLRHSEVEFDHEELEHAVFEGWLGATKTWARGFGVSFFVRKRSGEIKGPNQRNPLWSGFIVSYIS